MAQEDIAQLGIEVDSTGVEKAKLSLDGLADAGQRAEQSAQGVGNSWSGVGSKAGAAGQTVRNASEAFKQGNDAIRQQQQELGKLLGQIDPVVAALDRLDKQEEKLRGFRAAGALDADTFQQFKATLDRNRQALGAFDEALDRTGVSAGQTRQAIRQLPAQFSDIFISLQAGQSPLTVFLQQGAQIKDSFGGIGPALRETAAFARGLINPFTLAGAAVLALGVAYAKGTQEAVEFNKAIILTGNSAGVTADQLSNLAAEIDDVVGTQAQAAEALTALASSGKVAADQFELVATAAVALQEATGAAIEDTIAQYEKLAENPVDAAAKLNESINFLTLDIFKQIQALQEQGKTAEAAAVAQEALARVQIERAGEVTGKLGSLQTAWNAVTNAASEAWDAMLNVGREDTIDQQINEIEEKLKRIETVGARGGRFAGQGGIFGSEQQLRDQLALLEQQREEQNKSATQQSENNKNTQAAIEAERAASKARKDAQEEFDRIRISNLSKEQRLEQEIANIRKTGQTAGISEADIESQVEAARKQAESRASTRRTGRAPATPAVRDDAATRILLNLREQESALQLQLNTSEKLTSAERERAKFIQQIADLQSKDILTAEQRSLLSSQGAIKAQLDKNVAIEREIKLRDDALKLQDRIAQVQEAVRAGEIAREDQQADILGAAGLSQQEREIRESFDSIRKEYARYREELAKDLDKGALNSDEYAEAVNEIDKQLAIALEKQRKYFEELAAIEADATLGARKAVQDYIDESAKLGKQVNDLVGSSLGGLEDAFVELATTGKASFKDLADSIISDIIRIGTRLLISEALQVSGATGGAGGGGANIAGLFSTIAGAFAGGGAGGGYTGAFGFEGGGFTGQGQRAGGVDGRGGFMAVLHPNETVIDHTRPNQAAMRAGGNSVSIGNIDMSGVRDRREAREAGATVARQISRTVGGAGRYN